MSQFSSIIWACLDGERDSQTPATGVKSPPSQSPAPSSATGRRSRTPSRGAAGKPQRPPSQKSFAAPQPKPTASTANNSAANSPVPNAPRVGETVAPTPSESKAGTSPVPQSAGSRRQSVTTSNGTPKPRTPSAGSVRSKAATPANEGEASEGILQVCSGLHGVCSLLTVQRGIAYLFVPIVTL